MRQLVLPVVLLMGWAAVASGAEAPLLERYTWQGALQNEGSAGGGATAGSNLRWVDLGGGRQAAENTGANPDEIYALPQLEPGLLDARAAGIRISAWIKTRDRGGAIRRVEGTWVSADGKDQRACGFSLALSDGKPVFSARGANYQNQSLRGARIVSDGQWHYLTAASQPCGDLRAVVALYVDGKLVSSYNCWQAQMWPTVGGVNAALGFLGQMARLEMGAPAGFVQGSGKQATAGAQDPTWEAAAPPPGFDPQAPPARRVTGKNVVNVEDFGATGDGVTDDTEALQKAVAALRPGRDTLFLPEGTYKTTRPLRIPGGVDVVGVGATVSATGCPAVELVGDVQEVSFYGAGPSPGGDWTGLHLAGSAPAAVYQHGGRARHLYFENCFLMAPGDGQPPAAEPEEYRGRTSDGVLFTDVADSTLVHCDIIAGRAGVAVEGRMSNLAVLRTFVEHEPTLCGFYFDTPAASSCLLLNNTVHACQGPVIKTRSVGNLVMRGMSTEANGVSWPPGRPWTPMYDITGGTNVDLEMINLATYNPHPGWGRRQDGWQGALVRMNGEGNTLAGCWLINPERIHEPAVESNDPKLVAWGVDFLTGSLTWTGAAQRRVVLASQFGAGKVPDALIEGDQTQTLNLQQPTSLKPPASPETRPEPELWGPPQRRFTWGDLGLASVRDFGAVGDGKTDDTRAVSRALARGGTVYVPAGTYLVTGPLHPVAVSGRGTAGGYPAFALLGEGRGKSILQAAGPDQDLLGFPPPATTDAASMDTNKHVPYVWVHCCVLRDLSLVGGRCGVHVDATAGCTVANVEFRDQQTAGFAADYFDNGNALINCRFTGADYGFLGGGGGHCFLDKTLLWKCVCTDQRINGMLLGSVPDAQGRRPGGLWMHTALRDCTVRGAGAAGVAIMCSGARPVFLDHCLIENCGRTAGGAYVSFLSGGNTCAAAYYTTIRRTGGPVAHPLLDVSDYTWARFQDVTVTGAAGGVGVRVATPYCWLERVRSDGSLETPGGYRLVDSSPGYVGTPTGPRGEESRLVEWCKFSPAVAAPGATP